MSDCVGLLMPRSEYICSQINLLGFFFDHCKDEDLDRNCAILFDNVIETPISGRKTYCRVTKLALTMRRREASFTSKNIEYITYISTSCYVTKYTTTS